MYYSLSFRERFPWCAYFGRYRQQPPWDHRGKTCPFHLLVYVVSGTAEFQVGEELYPMQTGDVLLIPENTHYTAATDSYCEYYFFHFTGILREYASLPDIMKSPWGCGYQSEPKEISEEPLAACFLASHMPFAPYRDQLLPLCAKLNHYLYINLPEAEYEFQLIFSQLLLEFSKCLRMESGDVSTSLLNKITYFIHEHLTESLSLVDIAEHFNISKSYLTKLFRQHLHTSVTVYINRIKMDYAAQLLRTSLMNVSEISVFLGYHDPAYFSRVFKKYFGQSPSKYIG